MSSKKEEKKTFGLGMEVINSGINTSKVYGGRCICSPGGWSAGSSSGGCACGCGGLISVNFAALNNGANHNKANE